MATVSTIARGFATRLMLTMSCLGLVGAYLLFDDLRARRYSPSVEVEGICTDPTSLYAVGSM